MNYNYKREGRPELEVTCLIPGELDESFVGELERLLPLIVESVANYLMEDNDPICMVLMPDGATTILPISEAEEHFGKMSCEFTVADDLLLLRCEASDMAFLGDHAYLVGPALVFEADEDGEECNIDGDTVSTAMAFFEENITEITVDGSNYLALRLM